MGCSDRMNITGSVQIGPILAEKSNGETLPIQIFRIVVSPETGWRVDRLPSRGARSMVILSTWWVFDVDSGKIFT